MKNQPDKTLDCMGLFCPEPVYRTRIELDKIEIGEILEVIADDPAAEADIKFLIENLGQELLEIKKDDEKVVILIRKVK
jgi:TusA-related sulfurtransferase